MRYIFTEYSQGEEAGLGLYLPSQIQRATSGGYGRSGGQPQYIKTAVHGGAIRVWPYLFDDQQEEEKVTNKTDNRDCRQCDSRDDVVQEFHVSLNNVSRLTNNTTPVD